MQPPPTDYKQRITTNPNVMAGKPVIRGTRLPVERVIWHLADNPDVADVLSAFPHITVEDVKACLAYAYASLVRSRRRRAAKDSPVDVAVSA